MEAKIPTSYTSPLTMNSTNFTNSSLKSPPTPPASTPSPKMEAPTSAQGAPGPPRAPQVPGVLGAHDPLGVPPRLTPEMAPPGPPRKSSRCDCPRCREPRDKNQIKNGEARKHECWQCGKLYGKTSHLKVKIY